jgi:hypothetical protein
MTETTKSVMDYVKDFTAANPTFTAEAIRAAYPDKPANQLATALWKLRNKGVVSKDDTTGVFTVLTGVNALPTEAKPEVKEKPKAKAKPKVKATPTVKIDVEALRRDALKWEHNWNVARESSLHFERLYYDALAVIKYLEAKNGGNS